MIYRLLHLFYRILLLSRIVISRPVDFYRTVFLQVGENTQQRKLLNTEGVGNLLAGAVEMYLVSALLPARSISSQATFSRTVNRLRTRKRRVRKTLMFESTRMKFSASCQLPRRRFSNSSCRIRKTLTFEPVSTPTGIFLSLPKRKAAPQDFQAADGSPPLAFPTTTTYGR